MQTAKSDITKKLNNLRDTATATIRDHGIELSNSALRFFEKLGNESASEEQAEAEPEAEDTQHSPAQ